MQPMISKVRLFYPADEACGCEVCKLENIILQAKREGIIGALRPTKDLLSKSWNDGSLMRSDGRSLADEGAQNRFWEFVAGNQTAGTALGMAS
jgi:hypothetical protein